jgi:hypothetical protein
LKKYVLDESFSSMTSRPAKFTQSHANRLFKAAAKAGVNLRVEFHPDGTIIATTDILSEPKGDGAPPSEAPEEIRKLI